MSKFTRRSASRREAPHRCLIESLENRRLLSVTSTTTTSTSTTTTNAVTLAATQPTVRMVVSPSNGVLDRDGFLSASVNLVSAGNGVDVSTLSTTTVLLRQVLGDGSKVFVNANN